MSEMSPERLAEIRKADASRSAALLEEWRALLDRYVMIPERAIVDRRDILAHTDHLTAERDAAVAKVEQIAGLCDEANAACGEIHRMFGGRYSGRIEVRRVRFILEGREDPGAA